MTKNIRQNSDEGKTNIKVVQVRNLTRTNSSLVRNLTKLKITPLVRYLTNGREYYGNQYESGLSAISPKVQKGSAISPNLKPIDTRKEIARMAGVGESSVRQFKVIQKEGTEEQKERARMGGKSNDEI